MKFRHRKHVTVRARPGYLLLELRSPREGVLLRLHGKWWVQYGDQVVPSWKVYVSRRKDRYM